MASRAGAIVGVGLGVAGAGLLLYELLRPSKIPVTGSAVPVIRFGGIDGLVQAADGGALPALTTRIENQDAVQHSYTLAAASGPIQWTAPQKTLTLASGTSQTVSWNADYARSDGSGPFQTVLDVGVDAMPSQTFQDPSTFTVAVAAATPAVGTVAISEDVSGTMTLPSGNAKLGTVGTDALVFSLTNSGGQADDFFVEVVSTELGGATIDWTLIILAFQGGSESPSTAYGKVGPIHLTPGQVVDLTWAWWVSDLGSAALPYGTYSSVINVTWSTGSKQIPVPDSFTLQAAVAQASLQFAQSPTGTYQPAYGSELDLNTLGTDALQLVLTNTGQASGDFTVVARLTGPSVNGNWFLMSMDFGSGAQTLSTPTDTPPPITLGPQQSATLNWGIALQDVTPTADDGTYSTTVEVSW